LAPGRWRQGSRDRIFDLSLVFWCFIWQVLQPRTSCRAVVRHVQAFCETGGRRIDENSSAYCQARQRLPVACIQHALEESARAADSLVPQGVPGWSRPVKVVDGTSVQLADTGKNRARYPYASGQKPGCGFPVMKVLALYSLASGAILKTVQAIWSASDYTLFRQIWAHLLPGDVIMGDRAFCSYEAFASLPLQGVDIVCRMHQTRIFNRHEATKIGPNDWLATWKRLKVCKLKRSMASQDIARLPASIAVRIIHVKATAKGFRTKELWIATTLLDPVAYPAERIAQLNFRRWSLELCFRDLKTTMGMEVLRCQTPDMVHKELLAFLVAHNFIRCLIAQSAHSHSTPINRISFKGTVDASRSFFQAMRLSRSVRHANLLYRRFLEILARDRVPHRPDRREPRAVKRRPKSFQLLTKPRHLFKECPHRSRYKAPHHA
jgi:hypothetical protein